jgi:outer membrane receptor protein involved in Fe transport
MMKKIIICAGILLTSIQFAVAQVKLDSVVVDAKSLRDERALSNQAVSYNHFTSKELQSQRIFSVKGLTGSVPNLYVPDYGSKLTSSIYIRGIGSRINSSAVGVYVDDFPYYDKSAFDFDFSDVNRVDVLRGPQGTLYGMNSMGGIIDIHTKSPFEYAGTDLFLSAATKNNYRFSLTHYHRISKKFAFSAGALQTMKGASTKISTTEKTLIRVQTAAEDFMQCSVQIPSLNMILM